VLEAMKVLSTEIEKRTRDEHREEVDLLQSLLTLYHAGFDLSNYHPAETFDQLLCRKGLVAQNFVSLNAAVNLALTGFYLQSLGMLKNVYENWLAFWYVAKFPDDAHYWLESSWEKRPPKAETMRNKIDHQHPNMKSKLKDFYSELNRFSHTDAIVIQDRYVDKDGKPTISAVIKYEKRNFRGCTYLLLLWIGNMLDALSVWIPKEEEWHKSHAVLGDRIIEYLDQYWPAQ